MSTQLLGNVELVTKSEVEAMIDEVIVPEERINQKVTDASGILEQAIAQAKSELNVSIDAVSAGLSEEVSSRTSKTTELTDRLSAEEQARASAVTELSSRINSETGAREAADQALVEGIRTAVNEAKESLKELTSASFPDSVSCVRIKDLPIAQLTIDLHDATLDVGDTIGTVGSKYIPVVPVTFAFVAELDDAGTLKSYYIVARIDSTGNVKVINKTMLAASYIGNVNTATVTYITQE